jgi:hypothetical protein
VNYDSQGNTYEATFELPAGINANKAYVCGTAMDSGTPHQPDWRRNRFVLSPNAMSKQKDGRFTCTMRLPVEPGQSYYYFYWLDGKRDGKHAVTDSGFHDKIGSVQYAVIRTDAQDELANQGSLVQGAPGRWWLSLGRNRSMAKGRHVSPSEKLTGHSSTSSSGEDRRHRWVQAWLVASSRIAPCSCSWCRVGRCLGAWGITGDSDGVAVWSNHRVAL